MTSGLALRFDDQRGQTAMRRRQAGRQPRRAGADDDNGARFKLDETQPLRPVIEVHFGWNEKVRDDDLRHLKQFTKLHSLSLEATNISDVGLQHIRGLRDLKRLNLAATNCTDVSMGLIAGFTTLESLNVELTIHRLAPRASRDRRDYI